MSLRQERAGELTAAFGIAGVLEFAETPAGLVKATVANGGILGEFYLQGAHVTAWRRPGGRPVLFTSPNSVFMPGRAIRGGIPVIFPWFGANAQMPAAPQHGFARAAPWHLEAVEAGGDALTVTFGLGNADITSPFWPERFRAVYSVTFGKTLSLRLAVQNRGRQAFGFEAALHSYFSVSDIAGVTIGGLAGATYIDKTDGGARKQDAAVLVVAAETDRVYLNTAPKCTIDDSGRRHRITIAKDGAASTVVWNPWAERGAAMADLGSPCWREMVCVETGNIADNAVRIAANAEHEMTTTISVGALPTPAT
jgi:D-hexose-6-phosphate mutarotase